MPTCVFDFDSTLVACESLEEILGPRLAGRPDLADEMRAITALGMEGRIPFIESLRRRIALAAPTLADVRAFGARAHLLLTPGMDELLAELRARGADVSVVSGAFREAMLPLARRLGIRAARVHGARARWGRDGRFLGFSEDDPFAHSKAEGALALAPSWARPRVGVGDGMTAHELLARGAVDHFIAFTQNARREPVLATGAPEARTVAALRRLLEALL